jgi:histidinol phosphatase-like PHP family hydrolase
MMSHPPLLSDGELTPAELARRFEVAGYSTLAITDHGDQSNIDLIIPRLVAFCEESTVWKDSSHSGIRWLISGQATAWSAEAGS